MPSWNVRAGSRRSPRDIGTSDAGSAEATFGAVSLVWAIPVVAAAAATVLVVAWSRVIENEATGLVTELKRLREVAGPLGALRDALRETDEVAASLRQRHRFGSEP
jgi:hypothetical protein